MGNEYNVTCRHGNSVYRGSSKSDYDYHRNNYTGCSQCHREDNEDANRRARDRADQRRIEEERRVQARAAELERQERERQARREEERRAQRRREHAALQLKRAQEATEREERRKQIEDALKKKADELEREAERLRALKLQQCDPFLQYKKLDTLQTIKEIGKQVRDVAVVGEIVKERVAEISTDLEDTLGDDYKLIKKEMDRYEKYGEEMTSMTCVLKDALQEAFDLLQPDIARNSATLQSEANQYQKTIDEEDDDDVKEYAQKKQSRIQEKQRSKLKAVDDAIRSVEGKLKVMESYYDQMMTDYGYFEKFINTKEDELAEVIASFQSVANQIKKAKPRSKLFVYKESELYDEYKSTPQILEFTENYEYKETHTHKTGIEMGQAVAGGAYIGAVGGAVVGGLCAGGPGLIGGAITGMVLGAGIGAIVGLCNKPEYKVGYTSRIGTVTVTSDLIAYNGKEHAAALEKIIQKLQDSETYKTMKNTLEENQNKAREQRQKLKDMKTNMMRVQQPLTTYKLEMNKLRNRLKNEIEEEDAKMIDKKLQKLAAEMMTMIESMDQ